MRVAILTNHMEWNHGYSLTGIIQDQVDLLSQKGHNVILFVNEKFPWNSQVSGARLRRLPFSDLIDYTSKEDLTSEHLQLIATIIPILKEELQDVDVALTHDFLLTGWFLPYGLACLEASKDLPKTRWFHWIHSIPSGMKDWWTVQEWGSQHRLVFPNETDKRRVAEQYRGWDDHVITIPHIKDPRTWFDFGEDSRRFINSYPNIMKADVVQILPASADRLKAKRVSDVIRIFSELKNQGKKVFLAVADQWATTRVQRQSEEGYEVVARMFGLELGKEFVFTSTFEKPKYDQGIPRKMLRELMLLSNLFVFPTEGESFGLVVPEAALCGALLVLNDSLVMQREVSGNNALFFPFGSYCINHHVDNPDQFFRDIASIVIRRMVLDQVIKAKTFCRQTYNMDTLYEKYYLPIFKESETWLKG